MKTSAGKALNQRKPIAAPITAAPMIREVEPVLDPLAVGAVLERM